MTRTRDITIIKDRDGKPRVWGWIALSAPEKTRRLKAAKPLWGTMPVRALALQVGIPVDALRRAFDEPYKQRLAARIEATRAWRAAGGKGVLNLDGTPQNFAGGRAIRDDVAARLAEIPPDDRSITGRIAGDPLPGRSALDQRMKR